MPRTYVGEKYGVTYKYQVIRPSDGGPEKKHRVFKTKEDWRTYYLTEYGYLPPFCPDWRNAKVGEWVQGDGEDPIDRGIVEILFKKVHLPHPNDVRKNPGSRGGRTTKYAKNGYCRTVVGTFICAPERIMTTDFDKVANRYRFDHKTKSQKFKERVEDPEVSLLEKQWLLVCSVSDLRIDTMAKIWLIVHNKNETSRNLKLANARVDALLKKEYVMNTLLSQIQDKLRNSGITVEEIIDRYDDLSTGARREDIKLSATDRLSALLGVNDELEKRRELAKLNPVGERKRLKSFGGKNEINVGNEEGSDTDTKDMIGTDIIEDAQIVEDEIVEEDEKIKDNEEELVEKAEMKKDVDNHEEPKLRFNPSYDPKQADLEIDLSRFAV